MKIGSMQGLLSAAANMKLAMTPMRIYQEAELKGDTETMERAMGYASDFQTKTNEYSDKAQEELAKELKEERKEQEIEREQATLKRRAELKEYNEKLQNSNKSDIQIADSVEFSEEVKAALKNNVHTEEPNGVVKNTDVKVYASDGKPGSIETAPSTFDVKIGK